MTAAPRGPDLSFLNEEEARAIFEVLQRDSKLRRAEKDRVRKLQKRKKSETGLQGVTGEWFEEIQRKKFQDYTDVNGMLKPPLEHQLRKSKTTNHKELKMSSCTNPQAQKNTSASFLGFRSPFAWLFSFRKSRKNQPQKEPRYDSPARPSSNVEEMATAEMCHSPMPAETNGRSFDANQNEMMEKSPKEWNEQLEKEFFSVLNDLDDQLAQEQAQEPLDRTVSTSSASNVECSSAFPSPERQTASRGQHRHDGSDAPSTFFPDGLRTIRAKDEHKIFIRPRKLQSAYINWHQTAFQEDYKYGDPADGNRRRLSSASFGRSSEGSLYPPSVTQNSGFRHKTCMSRDTAGRSYSVCSLRTCPSTISSDELSASSLQHPFARESSNGFVPRFGRQNPKRTPLSSIVWNNTPDSPGHTSTPEKVFRTQSLMEFHATDHGRYRSSSQETKKYACYHSKHHYRRSFSSSNCFSRVSCPDKATSPLPFDNWENYPLYKSENNLSRSYYRDASPHGKLYPNERSSPYGKDDSYSWADMPQYYSDETFISSDASFEMLMANLNDQPWARAKNAKLGSQRLQNSFHGYSPENMSIQRITRSANRTGSEFTEGCQPWRSRNSSVSSSGIGTDESVFTDLKDQTKPIGLNRNSVVTQGSTKADLTRLEKAEGMKLPDEGALFEPVSQQADTNYIDAQSFPSNSPASATLPSDASLLNTMRSKRQTQVITRGDIAKIYTSKGDRRNAQMKENSCPPSGEFSQPPSVSPADKSGKEPFLPSQKEWEHHLHYAGKRESTKQDNRSAEAINQGAPKRQSSLLNVASAPSADKLARCRGVLSCPPECSSGSSQRSPQALSRTDSCRCLESLTSSSVNCTATESQAEGGKTAQVSRKGVTKEISQKPLQNTSTLVSKSYNGQLTTSSPQNGNSGNISVRSFGGDPRTSEDSLSYFCLEKESGKIRSDSPCVERLHKPDSWLRRSSSRSITGSPRRNSVESPEPLVIYYTLPRKSASIAGSMRSGTPISLPRESRTTYDYLRSETPPRAGTFWSHQRRVSCSDSKHSFLTPTSLNAATSNKEKDYPSPLTKCPSDSVSPSTSAELTDRCEHLTRRESSGISDCKERGNFLQKYKTTSTFTVCVDEDHIKYHELVSIYYTLPRRHSRTFCNLFRDNAEDADLPCPKEDAQSPRIGNKKNEGHVSLANSFFPSTLEKEVPSYSSDHVSSALVTPQNLETAVGSEEAGSHLSPSSEKRRTSKSSSVVPSRKGSSAENVLSDRLTKELSLGGPQSAAAAAESGKAVPDASGSQNAEIRLKEKKELLQTATPPMSTLPTPAKPGRGLENPLCAAATNNTIMQKGNSENRCQPPKVSTRENLNRLLLPPGEKSSLGRNGDTERADVPLPPAEDAYRASTGVKRRVNFLHQTTPLYNSKGSGLPLTADRSRENANYLNSCSKALSESRNKASEVSAASRADQLDEAVSTGAEELKNSKIRKAQSSQSTGVRKGYGGSQGPQRHSEGSLNISCKVLRVTPAQKITQGAEDENKLLSDCTRDKVKDIEKRKNRPSVKNKLAAVYKTSRKFSSKNLPPKPQISNIFSQNNGSATSLEMDTSLDSLVSTDSHQPLLQSDDENQNHRLDPGKNTPRPRTAESKKAENQNDPSLLVSNTSWRPFTRSYSQKEAINPPKTTAKVENRPSLTALFPHKAATTRNDNSQPARLRLGSQSQPVSPSAFTSGSPDEEGRAGGRAGSPPLPLLTDTNSNAYVNSRSQAGVGPEQNSTARTALGRCQNTAQSAGLENANLLSYQLRKSHARGQRERHLSEGVCARDAGETFPSGSNFPPGVAIHGKRFKSYSELLSCDENENWASDNDRCYSTRNLMYPSVEFGIFGKEQQLAFLENIKRSLTEGRLWRPCLLNNPAALRDGEPPSLSRAELLSSSSAGSKMSSAASSPREPADTYQEDPAAYSDSDSDTTTDDEYYLDEADKESEL